MQHNDSYNETTYGFVNNITTPEGGTHVVGFRNALTKTFNDYARKNKLLKENETNLAGEDIREGLTAIISVKIEEPQFEGQTKQKLGNSEARGAVDSCGKQNSWRFFWSRIRLWQRPSWTNLYWHSVPEMRRERPVI